jgi:hypothetical protein
LQKVGCDWILDSLTQEDSCGVCGGDDSSCDFYNGQIQVLNHRNSGKKFFNLNPSILYTFESKTNTKKKVIGHCLSCLKIHEA